MPLGVHAIRNFADEDAETVEGLTSYVTQFRRVKNFDSIEPATGPVLLFHDKGWQPVVRRPRGGRRKQ